MTATRTAPAPAPVKRGRPTLLRLMRSEWIKLRTLRSTIWCFALIFIFQVGLASIFAPLVAPALGEQLSLPGVPSTELLFRYALGFTVLSMLVSGVLGVLVISGEYSTGMIRSSFSAAPKRWGILVAKGIVFTAVTLVVSAIAVVTDVLISRAFFVQAGATVDLFTKDALLAALGAVLFIVLIGLMGFGFGMLLRNGAAGIGALVGLVLIVPLISVFLAGVLPWVADALKFFPLSLGNRLIDFSSGLPDQIPFWQALLALVGWVVVILVPAMVLARKRDA